MNFGEMVDEVQARYEDTLTDARAGQYVNWAFHELEETELWPFREAFSSGTAPLAISDLGTVETVINTSRLSVEVPWAEYTQLVQWFGDLSITGTPEFWYRATPAGVPEIATYPVSTDTISVQYWSVSADLTGSQTPSVPTRFHKTIVDMAVREAYRGGDNHQFAEALQAQIDRDLARMRQALFNDQVQGPSFVRIVHGSDDA